MQTPFPGMDPYLERRGLWPLTDLLAQVDLGSAIILMACANKNACVAIKMMALPSES